MNRASNVLSAVKATMQTHTTSAGSAPLNVSVATNHIAKLKRGYFTGKASKQNQKGTTDTFNIESVVCGDGQRNKSGLSLRNLRIYASDRLDGGIESYYEVDSDFLMFTARGGRRGGNWHTRAVSDRAKEKEQTPVPRVNIPSSKRKNHTRVRYKLHHAALRWLYENRDFALSVGGPGERSSIKGVEGLLVRDKGTIFEKQNDCNCITAAITNAVDIVSGRKHAEALREYFFEANPHHIKIREATLLLREMTTVAEMRLLPKQDRAIFNKDRFAFLDSRKSSVYVVHVFEPKVSSHTVVIEANRNIIIDSAEQFPMRLSEELLRKCGGDHASNLRVGEVRMIVKQRQNQNNR